MPGEKMSPAISEFNAAGDVGGVRAAPRVATGLDEATGVMMVSTELY
jgi:hypothetical protein